MKSFILEVAEVESVEVASNENNAVWVFSNDIRCGGD